MLMHCNRYDMVMYFPENLEDLKNTRSLFSAVLLVFCELQKIT